MIYIFSAAPAEWPEQGAANSTDRESAVLRRGFVCVRRLCIGGGIQAQSPCVGAGGGNEG